MDVEPEAEPVAVDADAVQELQEKADQPRVAVDEADLVVSPAGLVLPAFAPVGDRARDQDLAIGQDSDFRLFEVNRGRVYVRLPVVIAVV